MSEKTDHHISVSRLYLLCRLQAFLNTFAMALCLLLFFSGCIGLLLRFLKFQIFLPLFITAATTALLLGIRAVRRLKFTRRDAAAILDQTMNAGGLLLAKEETIPLSHTWKKRLGNHSCAKIHVSCIRQLLLFLSGAIFFVLCLMIPLPERTSLFTKPKLDISRIATETQDKINLLEESNVLDAENAERFRETLENLRENKDALEPGKVFESLDSLDASMRNTADAAAQKMLDAARTMEQLASETETLENAPDATADSRIRKEAEELSKLLKEENIPALCGTPSMQLQNALATAMNPQQTLTKEQLRHIAKQLKEMQCSLSDQMKKLAKSELAKNKKQALEAFLKKESSGKCPENDPQFQLTKEQLDALRSSGCKTCKNMSCDGKEGCAGSGGISRGRGDAPMFYASSDHIQAEGKKEKLSADAANVRLGELLGMTLGAPETAAKNDGAGGSLTAGSGNGGESSTQRVSPRNKRIIKTFFSD